MMTDEELDSFEDACKDALAGMYGYSSKQYLELIAMIRQARAERDWIAGKYVDAFNALGRPDRMTVVKALTMAKEAVK